MSRQQILNRSILVTKSITSYLMLAMISIAYATDMTEPLHLDQIDVTAKSALWDLPNSTSVITATEIENSTATSLIDVLKNEANLNLRTFFGDDRRAIIDIRGMGDTAVSNVLIILDGVRINSDTLSGADLSSIPLNEIESIEILRGGGSVRYGNGAVGGVIHIKTKRNNLAETRLTLDTTLGSYATKEHKLNIRGSKGMFSGSFNAKVKKSDGYRRNGFSNSKDYSLKMKLIPSEHIDFYAQASFHKDHIGSPGGRTLAQFYSSSRDRRDSSTPFDHSTTRENQYITGINVNLGSAGSTNIQASYRDRVTDPSILNYSSIISEEDQNLTTTARYKDLDIKHLIPFSLSEQDSSVEFGVLLHSTDYLRTENGVNVVDQSKRIEASVNERAAFAELKLNLTNNIGINAGYRQDWYAAKQIRKTRKCTQFFGPFCTSSEFTTDFNGNQDDNWKNKGIETGVNLRLTNSLSAYASTSRSFRNPNADELVLASDTLQPQNGRSIDAGIKFSSDKVDISASAFQIKIKKEIFFGFDVISLKNVNFNLPTTTNRKGFEFDIQIRPLDSLSLSGNIGYVRPKIGNSDIPHVARLTANTSLDWEIVDWSRFNFSTNYVGSRYDGNDLDNSLPKLKPYTVSNAKLNFDYKNASAFIGVNNIFNEIYSTLAYSQTFYPLPERNFYTGVSLTF
jgi:iron complex outermembrane recepter protein